MTGLQALSIEPFLRQFGQTETVGFICVLARVSPLFVLAPLFSSRLVPGRVRGIVAVAIAIGLTPIVVRGQHPPTDPFQLGGLIAKEVLVGLAFSYAVSTLFSAVTVAGSLLDTSIGFSFGSLVDPVNGTQSTIISQAYSMMGLLVFIAINGDGWLIKGLARTYDLVPLSKAPALGTLTAGVEQAFVSIFISAIQVAGPVLIALILTDAAVGLVSRVVPQLNVMAVGFPAKVVVGLLLIGVSLPFVAGWLGDGLQGSVSDALHTLRVG
jgi:flagellar biosynthetic protein FliR